MLKKIKVLAALLIVACLFLPLSQCTQKPLPNARDQSDIVFQRHAVDINHVMQGDYRSAAFGLPFVLPMLMVLFKLKSRAEKLHYELLDVLSGALVLAVVFLHAYTGQLLAAGYLALLAAAVYVLASLFKSWMIIKYRYINRS